MNLSFLSPLFFIGLAAIAFPIIAHLISRKSGIKISFPAVRFLMLSRGDLATRSRIKDIILLLLRALILVLIVLMFAKPAVFSFSAKIDNTPKSIAIVIDNSFSMDYENNFIEAKKRALSLIETIPDGSFTLISPLVADNEKETAIIQDKNTLKKTIQSIELTSSYADNKARLQHIYSTLQKSPNEEKAVVFLTDLQKNGWSDEILQTSWLEIIDVSSTKDPANHAVSEINIQYSDGSLDIQTQISNFSNIPLSDLITNIEFDEDNIRESITIEPNSNTKLDVKFQVADSKAESGTVTTTHDKLKIDDIRYFIADGEDISPKILIVDGDPRQDSRLSESYYLAQALETISEASGDQLTILDNEGFLRENPFRYEIIYLTNVGELTPSIANNLESFVEKGGTLVIFLGNGTRASTYNTLFRNMLPGEILNIKEGNLSILENDSSEIFSKEIADKINQIKIQRLYDVRPHQESETIIGTSGESPFLIKSHNGKGNVFMFTSTADSSWNNFSITPVFVPIINKINNSQNMEANKSKHYLANEVVIIDSYENLNDTVVIDPNGKKYKLPPDSDEFTNTEVPGIYSVKTNGEGIYEFAVNVDPKESNLEKVALPSVEKEPEIRGNLVKVFKEIWRYFLWGVIALFVSESVFRSIFS